MLERIPHNEPRRAIRVGSGINLKGGEDSFCNLLRFSLGWIWREAVLTFKFKSLIISGTMLYEGLMYSFKYINRNRCNT